VKPAKLWVVAAVLATCAAFVDSPARADMASGAVLANTCFSCHGTDGKSVGDMPAIAGKSKKFIISKMSAYKSDALGGTVMNRIAKGFTAAEIESMAEFFSAK
jgi:sulfide dehydrogenase cytochrome subunit